MTEQTLQVHDNTLYMHYEPERPRDEWGFMNVGQTIEYPPNPRTSRRVTYHNTYYHFLMEAEVRFLSIMPPLKRDGTAYWRRDQQGRKIQLLPYRVLAKCGDDWVPMAIMSTVGFHKRIQAAFNEYGINEDNVADHLWRVFKGHKHGYSMGQWGLSYLRADPWETLIMPDDPRDGENSPWALVPNAMRVARDIQREVLPYYPAAPREDIYIRELMERLGTSYDEARQLYKTRKEVGLP